jgi:hypothetical protein
MAGQFMKCVSITVNHEGYRSFGGEGLYILNSYSAWIWQRISLKMQFYKVMVIEKVVAPV